MAISKWKLCNMKGFCYLYDLQVGVAIISACGIVSMDSFYQVANPPNHPWAIISACGYRLRSFDPLPTIKGDHKKVIASW